MHYSNDRILVTHVGSLPRSPALLDMLGRMEAGEVVDRGEFRSEVLAGLREAVREQAAAGIDIAGDGELPRIGFSFYAKDRMTGFGGEAQRGTVTDFAKFPGYAELVVSRSAGQSNAGKSASVWATPECVDEVRYDPELAQAREELDLFEDALKAEAEASGNFTGTFVTAVTPGILATTLLRNPENPAYARDEDYVFALARELRREYEYIVSRGHILQLDAPDLALERQILFVDRPLEEFQERMEVHVAALNEALENIPRDKVRMHVCWGNWDGPHSDDVDLEAILPIIYKAEVGGLSLACANPRHAHDNTYETFVVLDGTIEFRVGPEGEEKVTLGKWDTFSCPPGAYRGFRNVGEDNAVLLTVITGAVDARDDVCVPPSVGREIDDRFGGEVLDAFRKLAKFNEE